jgi:putative ATP-dependent endonuclease of OLD family
VKLVGFSVQKYRSIVQAQKLPLADLTILIGPNNEGKSNLLRALVVGMRVLSRTGNIPLRRTRTKTVRLGRLRDFQETYDWEEDFPVSLRDQQPNGRTIFDFEFELDGPELLEFREEFKSNLNGLLPIRLFIDRDQSMFVLKSRGPLQPS